MRGADTFTESLFTMRRLDDFVPADHPLRLLREQVKTNELLRQLVNARTHQYPVKVPNKQAKTAKS